jgi:hypothetical protein
MLPIVPSARPIWGDKVVNMRDEILLILSKSRSFAALLNVRKKPHIDLLLYS